MKIFVRLPCDLNNRVIEFKDMPVICQEVYMADEGHMYKVTEITKVPQPGFEATILLRRGSW